MKLFLYICLFLIFTSCQTKREYYSSGELKSEYTSKDGHPFGEKIVYYKDGSIKKNLFYRKKKLTGFATEYYPNGRIKLQGNYNNGLYESFVIEYFEKNGKVKSEKNYTKGIKDGNFIYYNKDGSIRLAETYRKDTLIYLKEFSKEGIMTKFYRDVKIETNEDTIYQDTDFKIKVKIGGSLKDIQKAEISMTNSLASTSTTFIEEKAKGEYIRTFNTSDTGKHILNLTIWEKGTTYVVPYNLNVFASAHSE